VTHCNGGNPVIDLRGHAALVTGGTQSIGQAISVALAAAGADIVVHGLKVDNLARETVERCSRKGVQVSLIEGDLSGRTDECVDRVFEKAMAANPDIDILINNAGCCFDLHFLDTDLASYEKTMRLNVAAPFFLSQRFAKAWVKRTVGGAIVITGSINGRLAEPMQAAYDVSKGAVEMMVKTLCVELAPHNIRVNGMAPGLIYTPLSAPALDQPVFRRWMEMHTPNGIVPGPEVCGETVAFLVSDAARHIHGQMVMVDGGMSSWQQPVPPDR
jgi:NAD(P)-dependent dehydrogenase (short-subunit alcohol dehydrogenase family)